MAINERLDDLQVEEDPVQKYGQVAILGDDAQAFLATGLGRYMLGKARITIIKARDTLETVDPHDAEAIMAAQNRIKGARLFLDMMIEAIQAGDSALDKLQELESEI